MAKHKELTSWIPIALMILPLIIVPTHQIQFKQSPCPSTFEYEPAEENDRYYGTVNLRINQTARGASFRIAFDRPAQLLVITLSALKVNETRTKGKNIGDNPEDSWNSPTTTIDNIVFIGNDEDVVLKKGTAYSGRIMVKFDTKKTTPMLESIYLNAVKICPADPVTLSAGNFGTEEGPLSRPDPDFGTGLDPETSTRRQSTSTRRTITSTTTAGRPDPDYNTGGSVTSSSRRPTVTKGPNSNYESSGGYRPDPVETGSSSYSEGGIKKPHSKPSTGNNRPQSHNSGDTNNHGGISSPIQTNNNNEGGYGASSGTLNQQNTGNVPCGTISIANPLVVNGQKTSHGQWPWHIALYKTEGVNLNYLCGGSLISKNKVVTAAHCLILNPGNKIISYKNLIVYLGKYNLRQYTEETGVQTREVVRLNINPAYNSSNFAGDIAILTLSSDVEYTNYVRPVCIWEAENDIESIVGKEGVVPGWGLTEMEQTSEELRMATLPIVSAVTCFKSNAKFYATYLSETAFCAGFRNGTSPCNGDSGGGLVIERTKNAWYLRGIVSLSVAYSGLNFCDPNYYVIFTDTARYLDFIRKNL